MYFFHSFTQFRKVNIKIKKNFLQASPLKREIDLNKLNNTKISDEKIINWTNQILESLQFLHLKNVIHYGVTPA